MNDFLQKIILGIIQGLTEFLPVSSSGHLEIAKMMIGDDVAGHESLLTTVVLHFATAMATMVVFRDDIIDILKTLKQKASQKFVIAIVLSMIPAAAVGVLLQDQIDALFSGNLWLVGICLLVTAGLLLIADRAKDSQHEVNYFRAIIIGISQAIAILPGISRSGATISTSVILGIDRSKAARFSFLMVVPLIFGKMAKDLLEADMVLHTTSWTALGLGFAAAFITGVFACKWMIALVKNSKLYYFSIYCGLVGAVALLYYFLG
ncbi:undecaprenyl-diphosphate phosphatase [Membranihabitans marinus]|uniref:undecaprenyl-diphosphate phosphatase n=1 Tax=Membranihabitans marinus TaxID=1227546 RepID=UPI001F176874|nr:undecaprenyl-diphosphate phosphatase [Membranihabitans marinus]